MASNPMQRKARNSFLLGMLITVIIAGVIIALLFMAIKNKDDQIKKFNEEKTTVYVLKSDVKSGQEVTLDLLNSQTSVTRNAAPSNAIGASQSELLTALSLQDKEGHSITASSQNGETTLKIEIDGKEYDLIASESNATEGTNSTSYPYYYETEKGERKDIELNTAPLIAKIDLKANTVLTADMLRKGNNAATDDVRVQEYNMVTLPTDLESEDFVDIRLMLPNGQDFIVLSKKEVTIPEIGGIPSADTIRMELTEMETLYMGNAIIDSYMITGSKLYATKYSEAGLQEGAKETYTPNQEVVELIRRNPNILAQIRVARDLAHDEREADDYSREIGNLRNMYINSLIQNDVSGSDNVQAKMEQSITSTQEARQQYLEGVQQ